MIKVCDKITMKKSKERRLNQINPVKKVEYLFKQNSLIIVFIS